jgi:hypothetical protein
MKFIIDDVHRKWSIWVAAFWGAFGAVITVLSALLYTEWDWRTGTLIVFMSATFAAARVLKQPGTDT